MFDVGFFELVLIFVIALLILGPERLPKVARSVGNWVGRAKGMFDNFRYELERESNNEDMRRKFKAHLEQLGIDEKSLSGEHPQPLNTSEENSIAPPKTSSTEAESQSNSQDTNKPS